MADDTKPAVFLTPEQSAARQLAEELREQKEKGIQHNKTVPGGHFIGTDGQPHDSEGRPVRQSGKKGAAFDPDEAAERLREIEEERAELQSAMRRSQAMAEAEAGAAPEAAETSTKKSKRAGKRK